MQQRFIAKIYVDKTAYHVDKAYDYLIPENLIETLERGCRVLVPFGNGNKKVQGLVESVLATSSLERRMKPIFAQLDETPMFSEEMFSMADFLVKNTFCTYYDAVKTILPIGANIDIIESYRLTEKITQLELMTFNENEQRLIEFLKTAKTDRELRDFLDCKTNPSKKPVVKSLLDKGIVEKAEKIRQKVEKKQLKMVRISDGFELEGIKLSPKQKEVLQALKDVRVATIKELSYVCGVGDGVIRNLIKKQIIEQFSQQVEDIYDDAQDADITIDDIHLSESQNLVFNGIMGLVNEPNPNVALLYGITGSGKTLVYIKIIEQALAGGKNAIMLVPEIALTTQLVSRFKAIFGDIIAVVHSSLSLSQRLEEFNRIKSGSVRIVIGTRSAVFSPLENIGVIIMDEEGENTYKSEQAPRYHAREISKLRCVSHNATLILGSATPSIDSYYNASIGKYSLFEIEERFSNANLPSVYLIDMKQEQRKNNISPISEVLQKQLKINLEQGEQSIILINRRGYNTIATCMQCDEVITCQSCDVAMTYHKANGYLMCHYCGNTKKFDQTCPSCKGNFIKLAGIGTQKVEDELQNILPQARILRMDTDTTHLKDSYEKSFTQFKSGKYDIMLGTQMIAKGLDFPNVTLVGVINADSGLYSSDFKSSERIFSLITQVVGRSGRSEKTGRAYIQTLDPDNEVIKLASKQDYKAFYMDELETRSLLTYPPFCDICVMGFSGANEKTVEAAALKAVEYLKANASKICDLPLKVLGVTPANIHKISNKYRYRIIIKCKNNNKFKGFMSNVLNSCGNDRLFGNISVSVDINGDINS